jgi:hypothetical protein
MTTLFIHIPKTGGTTIRQSNELRHRILLATPENLCDELYVSRLRKEMAAHGDRHGFEHARWRDWREDLTATHRAVAVVRNPWDRVVSRFYYAQKLIFADRDSDHYRNLNYANVSSFEAFLEERHKWSGREFLWHRAIRGWFNSFDHVCDSEQNNRCDVLRFEHLDNDVQAYFGLRVPPQRRNVTGLRQQRYQEHYDNRTEQIVADWFSKDIEFWGFRFDSGATRNFWSLT